MGSITPKHKTLAKNKIATYTTGNRKAHLPEFAWSDEPCANGHIGWRRVLTGTSNGKRYRHTKCEQCRKDNRRKNRHRDRASKYRTVINVSIRARLDGVKRKTEWRNLKADKLLGIRVEEYIEYIESTWSPGMTWLNWGEHWQIDHIEPCHTFDLDDEDDLLRCFHYTNTHPVQIKENAWTGKTITVEKTEK